MSRTLLLPPAILAIACTTVALALTAGAAAHRGAHDHDEHHHDKEPREPTAAQIAKRLQRVVKRGEHRQGNRKQRQKDRKRALRKRLYHRLRGGAITPEVKEELQLHAKRVAMLRRARFVAAVEKDYTSVLSADKALARENARHEAWWRKRNRKRDAETNAQEAGKDQP